MNLLGLVRHGITAWNKEGRAQGQTDIPLDDEGIMQARALAQRLSGEEWDVIYASDLIRAKQTAEIIAERVGLADLQLDARLREMHCGKIEGTTEAERIAQWGENWRELDLGIEQGEALGLRGAACIEEIMNVNGGKRILIVSHGALLGWSLKRLIPHVDTQEHLRNTSITRLKRAARAWECELYNCTLHLEG